jgi:hypothetical protein
MQVNPAKKNLLKKQIPTLLGLGVLVIGLVVGVGFLSMGGNLSFAPRASAEETPKKIKITNLSDSGFTVSFLTDGKTSAFVKYGESENSLKSQVGDDRDQLSGTVGSYNLHHVTVRGLSPNTTYYYTLGTGSGSTFDNQGSPFSIKTMAKSGTPTAAKTIYGTVLGAAGSTAKESIVYVSVPGAKQMSTLVKSSGSWAIPLSNARSSEGAGFAEIGDNDQLSILVQGSAQSLTSVVNVAVADAQPVESITLGQDGTTNAVLSSPSPYVVPSPATSAVLQEPVIGGLEVEDEFEFEESDQTEIITEVDLEASGSAQVVHVTNPKIKGKAKPNVTVDIEVNSDTQIVRQVTADANGNFELDLEALKQDLEPGDHTVEYTYIDPDTGEEVTEVINFTVEADTEQIAMVDDSQTTPYGSGNPYSVDASASSDLEATESAATASATKGATDSGDVATRTAQVATSSDLPKSGTVETTLALIIGGLFFLFAGGWSFFLAKQLEINNHEEI